MTDMRDDAPSTPPDIKPYEYPPIKTRRVGVGNINNEPPLVTRDPVTGEIRYEPGPE